MSQDVDELFGEGGNAAVPRVGLVLGLLGSGLLLTVLGLGCSTAPGGVLVLLAWVVIEKEQDRITSGFLPNDVRGVVSSLRAATLACVFGTIVLFVGQMVLLSNGTYDAFWGDIILMFRGS